MKIFIYRWFVGDEMDDGDAMVTKIRVYGLNEAGETVCLHVRGFHPWLYLELQTSLEWTGYRNMVKNKITDRYKGPIIKPFSMSYKQKLYFHHEDTKSPFLKLCFPSIQSRRSAYFRLQRYETSLFAKKVEFLCHEDKASPLLQLTCKQQLPTAGWIEFHGKHLPSAQKITSLPNEYYAEYTNIHPVEGDDHLGVPSVTIMSFDIETYSTNCNRMPDASIEGDCIFQIGVALESQSGVQHKILLTLGTVVVSKTIEVRSFTHESQLLLGFQKLIVETNPHVLIGYNIFGFDIPYMIHRAEKYGILDQFDVWGIPHKKHSPVKEIKWSSSAYSFQEFHYLDAEGRVFVDLLPVVKREYKFSNYKLKTVSTFFLGETKDPLTHHDIFDAYREGVLEGRGHKKLSACGKYCVQDAFLVLRLFKVLETWIGLVEMAKICNVPIMSLFTQGQQIKVFSQVYKKCMNEGILVQSFQSLPKVSALDEVDGYSGAYVFPPKPGVYDWVIPFDFSSLYPTTIIAYNIDYSTLVLDNTVPDDKCHIIEWEDHIGCEHDLEKTKKERKVCKTYRFRFCKEPMGVIPSLLQALLSQRSETKKRMKSISDETLKTVLDKRQLAYKVSANSMYGAMGVKKGYLPFMPGAMSTTAMGRMSIQRAAEYVKKKHQGQLIYGDSVTPDTPLYILQNGIVEILTIEDFFTKFPSQPYPQFKLEDMTRLEKEQAIPVMPVYQILGKQGWTTVHRVIRHSTKKTLYKLYSSSGIIEVTEDHSVFLSDGTLCKPSSLKLGQCLLTTSSTFPYHETISKDWSILKNLMITRDGMIQLLKDRPLIEYANIYWILRGRWTDLRFIYDEDDRILIDLENTRKVDAGLIYRIEKTCHDEMQTVYDIETLEGQFHCGLGSIVVKNTDSIYCHLLKNKHQPDPSHIWNMAKKVEEEFIHLFPKPMKLVFEEKIYKTFLILTKKRYMAYTCNQDGSIDNDLTIRGVLLARRDNCRWIRQIYESVVRSIMDRKPEKDIFEYITMKVLSLFQWQSIRVSDFVVSKLVGKDYKVKPLPEDLKKFQKRVADLQLKHVPREISVDAIRDRYNPYLLSDSPSACCQESWFQHYLEKSQPAHAQLAMKMRRRGHPVEAGTRIEYIVIETDDLQKAKLNEKVEDPVYFKTHCDLLRLDYLYYVQLLSKPLDQLVEIVYHKKDFTKTLYTMHRMHKKLMKELEEKQYPILRFESDDGSLIVTTSKSRKKSVTPCSTKKKEIQKSIYDFL